MSYRTGVSSELQEENNMLGTQNESWHRQLTNGGGKKGILNLKYAHEKSLVIEIIKWKWKNPTYIRFSVCSTAHSEVFASLSTVLIQSLQSVQLCSYWQHEVGMFIMVGCFESFNGKKSSFTYL